jgi:hypothetical protein
MIAQETSLDSPTRDADTKAAEDGRAARGFVIVVFAVLAFACIVAGVAVGRSWADARRDENASQACGLQGDPQGLAARAVKDDTTPRGYMCLYRADNGRVARREPLRTAP